MSDGARSGHRPRLLAREDEPPADEDFLFHLSRGGELLVQNRVVEAKEELERALEVRPQDAQGQDLLAGVYFRLGVYPTAIKLWRQLVAQFPNDAVLHVNLGLALFKTGQPDQAREHLEHALSIEPDHERAWGYLGLTHWRLGALEEAREAFLRGGQISMARRMEEQVHASTVPTAAASLPSESDVEVSAMRDAAHEGVERLGQGEVALSLEAERSVAAHGGAWRVLETGADAIPSELTLKAPAAMGAAPSLSELVDGWRVSLTADQALALGRGGELLLQSQAAVHARLGGLRAARGPLRVQPVERRYRGRGHGEEPLGGSDDPILRWQGPVAAVLGPPPGMHFLVLRVAGALFYVREEQVAAFDDRLAYESGELPMAGATATLVSFHGEGTVALRLARTPIALEVRLDDEVHVDPRALVGWIGRLFPSEATSFQPADASLALRGQGIVLLT